MTRECLDLFSGLGGFSAAFADADEWDVTTVEIEPDHDPDIVADVFDLRPSDFDTDFDVILVGQPCTVFTPARNISEGGDPAWDGDDPANDKSRDLVALVFHTLGLVRGLAPEYWFLENPIGRLRTIMPDRPTGTITQCQYGRQHQKPTDLWGDHPPMTYHRCSPGDPCHAETGSYSADESQPRLGVLSESDDPSERAEIPYGLSEAIRNACDAALDGDAAEQVALSSY